jgi:hypothetical protein
MKQKHSAEYLKVPIDANARFGRGMQDLMEGNPISSYIRRGAIRQGREFVLPLTYRSNHLSAIYKYVKSKGLTFGFADNDLLIHSDGSSCCSASDLYLPNTNRFEGNIVNLAKSKKCREEIRFSELSDAWIPAKPVGTYFNSKARILIRNLDEPDWLGYLRKMWKGEQGMYAPNFFDGVSTTRLLDETGLPVYRRTRSQFELSLR